MEIGDYFHYNNNTMKNEKPVHMTSLSGELLVLKTHGRIEFRGVIDTLEAEVIEAQVLAAHQAGGAGSAESWICGCLGEILDYLRALMAAEVKETPLAPPFLFGKDAGELHRLSHQPFPRGAGGGGFQLPSYTQGPLAARLNTLRAKVREAELLSVRVFGPGDISRGTNPAGGEEINEREDIILALNRLSSALWWLYCEYITIITR